MAAGRPPRPREAVQRRWSDPPTGAARAAFSRSGRWGRGMYGSSGFLAWSAKRAASDPPLARTASGGEGGWSETVRLPAHGRPSAGPARTGGQRARTAGERGVWKTGCSRRDGSVARMGRHRISFGRGTPPDPRSCKRGGWVPHRNHAPGIGSSARRRGRHPRCALEGKSRRASAHIPFAHRAAAAPARAGNPAPPGERMQGTDVRADMRAQLNSGASPRLRSRARTIEPGMARVCAPRKLRPDGETLFHKAVFVHGGTGAAGPVRRYCRSADTGRFGLSHRTRPSPLWCRHVAGGGNPRFRLVGGEVRGWDAMIAAGYPKPCGVRGPGAQCGATAVARRDRPTPVRRIAEASACCTPWWSSRESYRRSGPSAHAPGQVPASIAPSARDGRMRDGRLVVLVASVRHESRDPPAVGAVQHRSGRRAGSARKPADPSSWSGMFAEPPCDAAALVEGIEAVSATDFRRRSLGTRSRDAVWFAVAVSRRRLFAGGPRPGRRRREDADARVFALAAFRPRAFAALAAPPAGSGKLCQSGAAIGTGIRFADPAPGNLGQRLTMLS